MKISVIICTKNRANKLLQFLNKINEIEKPESLVEYIIINNGSIDNTREVLEGFNLQFEKTIINEPNGGLSSARNTGIKKSSGDILIFTDDDCYLKSNYLKLAEKIFDSCKFQYCGGCTFLYDLTDAQTGLNVEKNKKILPAYSFINPQDIHGANMIFKKEVINTIGDFDVLLGAGTDFKAGGDTDYIARASWAGFTGAHIPELIVYHHHGRKENTEEIKQIRSGYHYSGGAYYMKCILNGYKGYREKWIELLKDKNKDYILRQLEGAIQYAEINSNMKEET